MTTAAVLDQGIGIIEGGQGLDHVTVRGRDLEIVILIGDDRVPDHMIVTTIEGALAQGLSHAATFCIRSINKLLHWYIYH